MTVKLVEASDLATSGGLAPEEIRQARGEARGARRRVAEILEERLGLPPAQFLSRLAATFHFPAFTMQDLDGLAPAFEVIAYTDAVKRGCVALRGGDGRLVVALGDPFDPDILDWATGRAAEPVTFAVAHFSDLSALLARHEEAMVALDSVSSTAAGASASANVEDLSLRSINEDTSDIVRLVRSTLRDALKAGASDIHLETVANGLAIKFRIDGTLTQVKFIDGSGHAEQTISRVKILSELDIAERRIPQDGRFKALDHGREIDFRVSIMPSIHGEDAVVRILDKQALLQHVQKLSLDSLGFDPDNIRLVRKLAAEPYGMLLVTGPTGSGKTTTLYAAITEINHGHDKIITIEDPVEYQLPGVLQIPVNERKGLTFAVGLRSILRHDPDKIMVGEIRDPDTANIAVQSALTGHQVFTTVHANNVFDVIGRFMHMQVDLYSFISALNGILAQRLVRLNCPHCSEPVTPDPQLLSDSGLASEATAGFDFRAGRGCGQCRGTGYRGRKAIAEILTLTDELRELITAREPIRRIKDAARRNGTTFLRESALNAVRKGETTLQEINRVTFVE
jgi:general secretion pathway protein E